jgi:hypothetical protein
VTLAQRWAVLSERAHRGVRLKQKQFKIVISSETERSLSSRQVKNASRRAQT